MLIFCETETIKLWKGSRCCEARVNFLGTPVTRRHFAPSAPEATRFWRVPRRHGRGPARPPLGVLRRLGLHPAGPGGALRRDAGGRAHHRRRRRLERRIGRGGAGVLHHHGVGRGDRSGGVRGPLPPGLLSPKPLDFKSRAGRSQHERLGEDVSERTDRDCDREAERRTPFSSATADDEAAALAAFELAAERALRVEEARSNRLVRAHLHEARGEQIDVTDDDENISPSPSRSDATSDQAESSSSDDDTSVRARRRFPPRPRGRCAVETRKTREHVRENTERYRDERKTGTEDDEDARRFLRNTKREDAKEDANDADAFRVRLSGAAGRLARDANEKRTALDPTLVESSFVDDTEWERLESNRDVWKDAETAAETAFAAQTLNASEPSELSNAKDADPVLARDSAKTLDLGSALGGLDLDGLLRRLEAPGGEAVVASVTALRSARGELNTHTLVDLGASASGDDDDDGGDAGESDGRRGRE